jgi:hypothetical protein
MATDFRERESDLAQAVLLLSHKFIIYLDIRIKVLFHLSYLVPIYLISINWLNLLQYELFCLLFFLISRQYFFICELMINNPNFLF